MLKRSSEKILIKDISSHPAACTQNDVNTVSIRFNGTTGDEVDDCVGFCSYSRCIKN